jgi:hypothetical protein
LSGPSFAGAEELEKRLLLMQKEQKLIQEEAQQAVLQAAASQPAAMAGATVGQPAADSFTAAAPGQVGVSLPPDTWRHCPCGLAAGGVVMLVTALNDLLLLTCFFLGLFAA